jgi:hypothetical protein
MRDQPAEESKPADQVESVEAVQLQDDSIPADAKPEESLLNGVAKSTEPLPQRESELTIDND